jgi:transcriptional regulator with XRE-family HTH domain
MKLRLKEIADRTGLSRTVLARWCRDRVFRTASKLSTEIVRSEWLVEEEEIESARIQERIQAARYHGRLVKEGSKGGSGSD